jgi:hypothetical protein
VVSASVEFYSASAQVLPVLFLASAVEFRVLSYSADEVREEVTAGRSGLNDLIFINIVAIAGLVVTAAIGEGAALWALAIQRVPTYAEGYVIGALVASGAWLVLAPTANLLEAASRAFPASRWRLGADLAWLALTVAAMGLPIYGLYRVVAGLVG